MKKISLTGLFLLLTSYFLLPVSFAGNSNSFFLGNEAALTAGSIAAHTRDSEAIWYNPAGLGGNKLTRLDLSGTVFELRLQKVKDGLEAELPSGVKKDNLTGNEYLAVPASLTFSRQGTDRLSYGFGVYIPEYEDYSFNNTISSSNEDFSKMGIREPVDYEQGFNLDILSVQYHIGGAVGYEVTDRFRLGGGFFVVYGRTRYNMNQFESIDSSDGSDTTNLFYVLDERALISSIGLRATAGAQMDVAKDWKIGIMAFSPTFQIYSWGDVSSDLGTVSLDPSTGDLISVAARDSRKIHEWEGSMIEPFHTQVSVSWDQPDFWIGAAADIYLPLKNNTFLIDKKFNWNVCAGSKFKIVDKIWGGAGFFTDNSDQRTPKEFGESQINYYGLTFGAEFRTPIARNNDPNVTPIVFTTVLAGRYALGIGEVAGEVFDPEDNENITNARIKLKDVYFQELSAYVGTALYF